MFNNLKAKFKSIFGAKKGELLTVAANPDGGRATSMPPTMAAPYGRTTSHSLAKTGRLRSRWVHVAQWFKPIQYKDAAGVDHVHFEPQATKVIGKDNKGAPIIKPSGTVYNVGRNQFKRACRTLRINRTKAERDMRAGKSWADVVQGAVYG